VDEPKKGIRPFIDLLREVEHGSFLDELTVEQNKLVDLIGLTNKGGKITITLDYKPEGKGQMSINADFKVKSPTISRGKTLMYVTPENNLLREHPKQQKLPLVAINSTGSDKPALEELGNSKQG
jgi:hypothetical protein